MPGWLLLGVIIPTVQSYLIIACIFCLIVALELRWPRGEAAIRWNAVRFALFFTPASIVIVLLIDQAMRSLGVGVSAPLLSLSGAAKIIAGLLIGDFLAYWLHRAQHAIPALWRLHSVHHSIEAFGPLTGYQHLAEVPLSFLLYTLPVAILVGAPSAMIISILTGLFVSYLHSTTRLNFGRWNRIICDNRAHRIHHSTESHHFDHNFGMLTMVWDRLFGTAYFPDRDEWPDIGLDDMPEPKSLRDFVAAPFRRRAGVEQAAEA